MATETISVGDLAQELVRPRPVIFICRESTSDRIVYADDPHTGRRYYAMSPGKYHSLYMATASRTRGRIDNELYTVREVPGSFVAIDITPYGMMGTFSAGPPKFPRLMLTP